MIIALPPSDQQEVAQRLRRLASSLVNQQLARVIVQPNRDADGYWFGGGNVAVGPDGKLYLVGRYRNAGDSRTGVTAGTRGSELAIFASVDGGERFEKVLSWSKADLETGGEAVLSIEGAALLFSEDRVELFVSTEKERRYPKSVEAFQKPGTGVWSIDHLQATSLDGLSEAEVVPLIASEDPRYLHVKDPVIHLNPDGSSLLVFCTHPFNWTSSNSAYCLRRAGAEAFGEAVLDFFPRGTTWDVAVSRITDILTLPAEVLGAEAELVFYDGAECVRPHPEHAEAVRRPRGYSCEEISGIAMFPPNKPERIERISAELPLFISPWGSGSSRYIHALATERGLLAVWQQAQSSGAQPLVGHSLSWDEVEALMKGARETLPT